MSRGKLGKNEILIRSSRRDDMVAVADMIQELADFEKMSDGPKLTVQDLQRDGFDSNPPAFKCLVAEYTGQESAPLVVGYAIYFPTYSTWEGRAMMLEDLYVRLDMRRRGVGQMLFDAVAKEAYSTGCSRLDFHVLEWNDARAFYERKGAVNLTQEERWCYYRLAGDALKTLARS
ncbi:hypothetical protein O0L34_g8412 [Tuta absoluta]|nr:hypothetical protein O0L34_g8412 [Tuta absoluta]